MAAGILPRLAVNAAMAIGSMLRRIAGEAAHIVLRQDRAVHQMDHALYQQQQRHAVYQAGARIIAEIPVT